MGPRKEILVRKATAWGIFVVLTLMSVPSAGSEPDAEPVHNQPPALQLPEDAVAQDLALVAAANGWTIEEAAADPTSRMSSGASRNK